MADETTRKDEPTFEESLNDLQREELERKGELPPPWKTAPFWLSIVASVLAYTVATLPKDSMVVQVLTPMIFLLWYLGYDRVKTRLDQMKEKLGPNPAKTKGFWLDVGSTAVSYILGSGLGQADPVAGVGAMGALILGQFGVEVQAWIKQKKMVDPTNLPEIQKKLEEQKAEK